VASVGRYFWEEFLGIGVVVLGAGVYRLWTLNRRLLIAAAAWVVPVLVITVLFKLEGQHDFWFVAAWIPLWLVGAVGMSMFGRLREAAVAVGLIGTIWAVIANRSDLDQRNYTHAETLGRYYLRGIPNKKYFATASDDAYALTLYLKRVRADVADIRIIAPHRSESVMLNSLRFMQDTYFESAIGARWGYVPAGPLFRKMRKDETLTTFEEWKEPMPAEEIPKLFRRARGQFLERREGEFHVIPEAYEHRLLRALMLARKNKADIRAREGRHAEAAALYESILKLDPWLEQEPTAVYPLAVTYVGLQKYEEAEKTFKKALQLDLDQDPVLRAQAYYFLAALCGNRPEAAEWKAKALASKDLPSELRKKLEGR
jgi:hypothetical protein